MSDTLPKPKRKNEGLTDTKSISLKNQSLKRFTLVNKGKPKGDGKRSGPQQRAQYLDYSILKIIEKEIDHKNDSIYDYKKELILRKIGLICSYILNAISPQDIEKASLMQKVTSFGILQDKANLLMGLPTVRLEIQNIPDADLDSKIRDIVAVQ